ncbi:MAG: hypothetical protein JXQ90_18980 [Cyclobacteriaceae bacterium]
MSLGKRQFSNTININATEQEVWEVINDSMQMQAWDLQSIRLKSLRVRLGKRRRVPLEKWM